MGVCGSGPGSGNQLLCLLKLTDYLGSGLGTGNHLLHWLKLTDYLGSGRGTGNHLLRWLKLIDYLGSGLGNGNQCLCWLKLTYYIPSFHHSAMKMIMLITYIYNALNDALNTYRIHSSLKAILSEIHTCTK